MGVNVQLDGNDIFVDDMDGMVTFGSGRGGGGVSVGKN